MTQSVGGESHSEDASDARSFTKKRTRDLSHSDRLILQKAISLAMGKMEFRAKYDSLADLKDAITTQLERIGFEMPKVDYRPSSARNYVKYNIRRRLLAQGVLVPWNSENKTLLPAEVGATDLEMVSSPPTWNRRMSGSSDLAIYSPSPSDEPEPVRSGCTTPPPPPLNEPEQVRSRLTPSPPPPPPNESEPVRSSFIPSPPPPPNELEPIRLGFTPPPPSPSPHESDPVRSEVALQSISNRRERVSFSLKNHPLVPSATYFLSNEPELVGSTTTFALAFPEAEVQDDEDVYTMCKRTLSRLFTNQAGNAICPICEQELG